MLQSTSNKEKVLIDSSNAGEIIAKGKKALGRRCLILGHPSAQDTLLQYCDKVADENTLPDLMRSVGDARFVIMCAPRALAETADILTPKERLVFQPQGTGTDQDPIPAELVLKSWSQIATNNLISVTPVADIFVSANVKAFVGNHMGVICSEASGSQALEWGLSRTRHVFFLGDKNLGMSLATKAGLNPEKDIAIWQPGVELGGHSLAELKSKRLWLWDVEYTLRVSSDQKDEVRLAEIMRELAHGRTPREVVSVPRATAHAAAKGIRRLTQLK
jgi:quinolinate synthase